MKKITFLFMLLSVYIFAQAASRNGTVEDGWLILEDFENNAIEEELSYVNVWGGANESGGAVVAENPTDATDKVAHITGGDYNGVLEIDVTLPAGKVLADYGEIAFDLYRFADDENYKQMLYRTNEEEILQEENYTQQAADETWTVKKYDIPSSVISGNTFQLRIGIKTDGGNYLIDNIRLKERVSETAFLTVEDFESYNIDDALSYVNTWGGANDGGAAVVAENPTDATDKVAHITGGNHNGILGVNVTLPTGKVLADYEEISFYLYRNVADSDYKEMVVRANDDVIYFVEEEYIQQAPAETWTKKVYDISENVTSGNAFELRVGIKTNDGDYYINNIVLKERDISVKAVVAEVNNDLYAVKDVVYSNVITDFKVYAINGALVLSKENATTIDLSALIKGIYIVKANDGIIKVIK